MPSKKPTATGTATSGETHSRASCAVRSPLECRSTTASLRDSPAAAAARRAAASRARRTRTRSAPIPMRAPAIQTSARSRPRVQPGSRQQRRRGTTIESLARDRRQLRAAKSVAGPTGRNGRAIAAPRETSRARRGVRERSRGEPAGGRNVRPVAATGVAARRLPREFAERSSSRDGERGDRRRR